MYCIEDIGLVEKCKLDSLSAQESFRDHEIKQNAFISENKLSVYLIQIYGKMYLFFLECLYIPHVAFPSGLVLVLGNLKNLVCMEIKAD